MALADVATLTKMHCEKCGLSVVANNWQMHLTKLELALLLLFRRRTVKIKKWLKIFDLLHPGQGVEEVQCHG